MGWFIADLKTGSVLIRDLPVKSGSVAPALNKAGAISAKVQLPLKFEFGGVTSTVNPSAIVPAKTVLGFEVNGVILDAGPIWETGFDFDTWELTLTAAGLRSYFDHRYVLPANVATHYGSDSSFTNLSYRTIAKRIVQQAQAWTNGSLPITFEADVAGSYTRTYLGSDLNTVADALSKLSGVENGPDIDFRPSFNSERTAISWAMVTGSPELAQSGADWVWDMSIPTSPVRAASKRQSGSVLVSNEWASGGTPAGASAPIVSAASSSVLPAAGFPILEGSASFSSVITQSVLDAHASGAVTLGSKMQEQFEFSVSAFPTGVLPSGVSVRTAPWVGDYRVGDYGVLGIPDNPWTGVQRPRVRILGYSYDGGDVVKFTTAISRV